jgi:hypothetical protein
MNLSIAIILGLLAVGILTTNDSSDSYFNAYEKKKEKYVYSPEDTQGAVNISNYTTEEIKRGTGNTAAENEPDYVPKTNLAANLSYDEFQKLSITKDGSNPLSYELDYSLVTESYKMNDYQKISSYMLKYYKSVKISESLLIAESIVKYAADVQLDPKLIAALVAVESSFNPRAVSHTNARGLGQIKSFNYKPLRITNPFDIAQNVRGTAYYLREKFAHWKEDDNQLVLGIASYTEGYGAIKKANKQYKYATKLYIEKILKKYKQIKNIS